MSVVRESKGGALDVMDGSMGLLLEEEKPATCASLYTFNLSGDFRERFILPKVRLARHHPS